MTPPCNDLQLSCVNTWFVVNGVWGNTNRFHAKGSDPDLNFSPFPVLEYSQSLSWYLRAYHLAGLNDDDLIYFGIIND